MDTVFRGITELHIISDIFNDVPWWFPLIGIAVFMYGIAHHPILAIAMFALLLAFVVMTHRRWTLRLIVLVILVCAVHDTLTGEIFGPPAKIAVHAARRV
jgi:hypothetical protein